MKYGELKAKMDPFKSSVPAEGTNTGDGTVSLPKVTEDAVVETWTIVCTTLGGAGVAKFSLEGSVTGMQTNEITSDLFYTSDDGAISLLITAGGVAWAADDEFTFAITDNVVGMNDAAEIREIEYRRHSKVNDVEVGYDAANDAVRVIMVD